MSEIPTENDTKDPSKLQCNHEINPDEDELDNKCAVGPPEYSVCCKLPKEDVDQWAGEGEEGSPNLKRQWRDSFVVYFKTVRLPKSIVREYLVSEQERRDRNHRRRSDDDLEM